MRNVDLFTPIQLGPYSLPNRIAMAPMTRLRAVGSVPTPLMAEYYAQRASAGLIITECTMISPMANGYMQCPGIYTQEHVAGWRRVVEAVHARGGRIFLQLWHTGRLSHPALLGGAQPVAPSAIAASGDVHTPAGKQAYPVPRALALDEIPGIVAEFGRAAEHARAAGFDGVELHGAFAYLIAQFLNDSSNHRTDAYGGSIANRARFLLEVVEAVVGVWGGERVGIKLSPSNHMLDVSDSDPLRTYGYVLEALTPMRLAYVQLMEPLRWGPPATFAVDPVAAAFRPLYRGTIITNAGYDKASATAVLAAGHADMVSFGSLFLANPDLPQRLARDAALNRPDPSTFYGVGPEHLERGYTDYPALDA
jgi:N-ethylmaleimide reductase